MAPDVSMGVVGTLEGGGVQGELQDFEGVSPSREEKTELDEISTDEFAASTM